MNAERLHKVLLELRNENSSIETNTPLRNLLTALSQLSTSPTEPTYQSTVDSNYQAIKKALLSSKSNQLTSSDEQIMQEIGATDKVGIALLSRIDSVLQETGMLPSVAVQKFDQIVNDVTSFNASVDQITSGFEKLKIQADSLEVGKCEMGYTVPRDFVKNSLRGLDKELHELNFILTSLSEAANIPERDFKVRTISSSDYMFFLEVVAPLALILSKSIDWILKTYKTILEIKKLRQGMLENNVPQAALRLVEENITNRMTEEISKLTDTIMKDFGEPKDPRKNELTNAVTFALNKLANRLDRGFVVEIRVNLPAPPKEEDSEEAKAQFSKLKEIEDTGNRIAFVPTLNDPILFLEEGPEKTEQNDVSTTDIASKRDRPTDTKSPKK